MNMNEIERNAAFVRTIEQLQTEAVPSNFHTHCTFCDGRDEPEAIVQEALRLGCPAQGFSSHAPVAARKRLPGETIEQAVCRNEAHLAEYRACIRALRAKYAGKIQIFVGVEQDYFSETSTDDFDYVIGSVHLLPCADGFMPVDSSRERFEQGVQDYFGGDYYAAAETYYALVAHVYEKTHCTIIGHFDLITKYNEGDRLFSTAHPRYRAAAERALEALMQTPAIFERNYGAISRGYRTQPYMEGWMLEKFNAAGKRIVKTSDAHRLEHLLFGLN